MSERNPEEIERVHAVDLESSAETAFLNLEESLNMSDSDPNKRETVRKALENFTHFMSNLEIHILLRAPELVNRANRFLEQ